MIELAIIVWLIVMSALVWRVLNLSHRVGVLERERRR